MACEITTNYDWSFEEVRKLTGQPIVEGLQTFTFNPQGLVSLLPVALATGDSDVPNNGYVLDLTWDEYVALEGLLSLPLQLIGALENSDGSPTDMSVYMSLFLKVIQGCS